MELMKLLPLGQLNEPHGKNKSEPAGEDGSKGQKFEKILLSDQINLKEKQGMQPKTIMSRPFYPTQQEEEKKGPTQNILQYNVSIGKMQIF